MKNKFLWVVAILVLSLSFVMADPELGEIPGLDLIGVVLSIIVAIIALSASNLLQGDLKENWKYLVYSVVLLAVSGLITTLEDFVEGINYLGTISDITEIISIAILLVFVYSIKKTIKQTTNK